MRKIKIFNDPVYGFISIPYGIIFDLIEHPFFQRLRRIKQVGLTHYVYPGALHTRFHHALGAYHLMTQAIEVLRSKGIDISMEEAEAAGIAILLHDIGHGPFSHALEHSLINIPHEELSIAFMEVLNEEFGGALDLAIAIFKDQYHKHFLHQLVSGQLDMDRMDYLNRDSFFTGVSEGVIGYDRIIKMLHVKDGELVVEEKGIYSIEKFLIARRLMYWQVYLHKTALSAEQMLIKTLERAKDLVMQGAVFPVSGSLLFFLSRVFSPGDLRADKVGLLAHFARLDDVDIISALKCFTGSENFVLSYLSESLLHRKLFRVELQTEPFQEPYIREKRLAVQHFFGIAEVDLPYLFLQGKESNTSYSTFKKEIQILFKSGRTVPMSAVTDHPIQSGIITKHYLGYPKKIR